MHPNQIVCAWLWICLRQNCQISFKKCYLLHELLISKYWRQNISVSNIASHTAVRHSAHRAHKTVHLLTHETPDFITPALWPANSPDLNPVDYQIWWKLQDRVYRSHVTSTSWSRRVGTFPPGGGTFWTYTLDVLKSCHSHGRTLDSQSCLCV